MVPPDADIRPTERTKFLHSGIFPTMRGTVEIGLRNPGATLRGWIRHLWNSRRLLRRVEVAGHARRSQWPVGGGFTVMPPRGISLDTGREHNSVHHFNNFSDTPKTRATVQAQVQSAVGDAWRQSMASITGSKNSPLASILDVC